MSYEQAVVNLQETNAELVKAVNRVRDAAMGMNRMYSSTSAGVAAVQDGEYFVVPGGGVYQRLYQRSGGSASLIAEYPDRAELNSVIDQLGPLLGRGVVGGAGDLLANGAYGLGRSGYTLTNFDALPDKNEFFQGQGGSATGDIPPNTNYYPGLDLARITGSITRPVRLMFSGYTCYVRTWDSNNVPSTAYMFNNRNILGTASQSDGIPTGAIIERGSNANGEYVKLADGTLICTVLVALGSVLHTGNGSRDNPYRTNNQSGGWPHAFSQDPKVSVFGIPDSPISSANRTLCQGHLNRVTVDSYFTALVSRATNSSTDDSFSLHITATGRWF